MSRMRTLTLLLPVFAACEASRNTREPALTGPSDAGLAADDGVIIVTPAGTEPAVDVPQVGALAVCTTAAGPSVADANDDPLIDDFDDADPSIFGNGRSGGWFNYSDLSGEQQPPDGAWQSEPGGLTPDGYAARARGRGFSIWGAGQGVALAATDVGEPCAYDATAFEGITFWARGSIQIEDDTLLSPDARDRGVLKVQLAEPSVIPLALGGECDEVEGLCWDSHRARVSLGECWKRYALPFSAFAQDGWGLNVAALDIDRLTTINFEVAHNQVFDYELDELAFFSGEPPAELEDCGSDAGMSTLPDAGTDQ